MRSISILGSTGSIGMSTLDVIARHRDRFQVVGLAEGHDIALLAKQIEEFHPSIVSVRDDASAKKLRGLIGSRKVEIRHGIDGACDVAKVGEADLVVSAIVGAAGLLPTLAAIEAGKMIALANKETMVVAGELVSDMAAKRNVRIIPVDSEHSAIFQSLAGHRMEDVERVILTASGGPFRCFTKEEISKVTPEMALKHPRWTMGAKITIDSATLMNKGLEVIEARWLFGMDMERISVVVHPESIIHSMVEYCDGCVIAQLGEPDMRAPISYAISYPGRVESGVKRLDLAELSKLTFEKPDAVRFPCLALAYDAIKHGMTYPAVLNASNEIAVDAFLKKQISFDDIARIVKSTLDSHDAKQVETIEEIVDIDRWAREKSKTFIK